LNDQRGSRQENAVGVKCAGIIGIESCRRSDVHQLSRSAKIDVESIRQHSLYLALSRSAKFDRRTCQLRVDRQSKGRAMASDSDIQRAEADRQTLLDQFSEVFGTVPELPTDMAENHDHYLHGAPRHVDKS